MRFVGIVVILANVTWAGAAVAQTMAEKLACKDDFSKYCQGVQPGGGRGLACLAKQKDKLSPACLKVVEAHSQ